MKIAGFILLLIIEAHGYREAGISIHHINMETQAQCERIGKHIVQENFRHIRHGTHGYAIKYQCIKR